jgi:hypothetical protein
VHEDRSAANEGPARQGSGALTLDGVPDGHLVRQPEAPSRA